MKIIVDTNIVFSGILNSTSRIGKILIHSKAHFDFFAPDFLRTEILKHRQRLLKLTKLTDAELTELEQLITNNITFINEQLIPSDLMLKTEKLLQTIDPNDTPFVALATQLDGKLWTGDLQLYKGLQTKKYKNMISTAELSLLLDGLEK